MTAPGWDHKEVDPTFARKAVSYIEQRAASDQPFFLYLVPDTPHEPCVEAVVPEFARGKSQAGPRGDLVWLFDWIVGEIMAALDRTGQAENTLLIVTSDNGALPGDRLPGKQGMAAYQTYDHKSCGDWRGYKAHIWEGGHREPLIARWPGTIRPGGTSDALVCLVDLMETCAAIVGAEVPAHAAPDSVNLLPVLLGDDEKLPIRQDLIHHSATGVFALRRGDWKCIFETQESGGWPPPAGGPPEPGTSGQLYNLADDPYETVNLWQERADVVGELAGLLMQYQQTGRSVLV